MDNPPFQILHNNIYLLVTVPDTSTSQHRNTSARTKCRLSPCSTVKNRKCHNTTPSPLPHSDIPYQHTLRLSQNLPPPRFLHRDTNAIHPHQARSNNTNNNNTVFRLCKDMAMLPPKYRRILARSVTIRPTSSRYIPSRGITTRAMQMYH